MLGLPIAWLALRALGAGDDARVAIFAVIASRRSPASRRPRWSGSGCSSRRSSASRPPARCTDRHLRPVLALLGVQALAWELAWNTVW